MTEETQKEIAAIIEGFIAWYGMEKITDKPVAEALAKRIVNHILAKGGEIR